MDRRIVFLTVGLVVALVLGACGPSQPGTLRLTEQDAGRTIEVSLADTLEVVLESNPTTGYLWEGSAEDTAILKQVGEAEFEPESDLVGAGGKETLRFQATMVGQTTLNLVYHRPFEENVEPLKTFEVTVVVK